ncbi:MAG: PAS domain-containing protein [Myxococcales bacterium]|nr:PAS domain-containing protein [Myxococcales bacterium]
MADNPKTGELLAMSVEALRGASDREIGVPLDDVRRAISRFRAARAAGRPVPFEVTYDFAHGPRTLVGKVAPLPDEGGEERYAFIGEDVTEVRALEAGLMHADRLASLGTMAAGIAHEINNPLTYVQASLNFALHQLESAAHRPESQALALQILEEVRTASVGVDRIAALVREMLALARPQPAGPAPMADVALTVDSVLGLAASRLRGVAEVKREFDALPAVVADAMKLGQVLLNLLTNAAQALEESDRRGHIWIRGRLVAEEQRVVLTVEDDGPGIPSSVQAQLFAPFHTGRSHGHGLGLFLCRRLVTEMGGTIEASAREGGGTVMRVELRVAPR